MPKTHTVELPITPPAAKPARKAIPPMGTALEGYPSTARGRVTHRAPRGMAARRPIERAAQALAPLGIKLPAAVTKLLAHVEELGNAKRDYEEPGTQRRTIEHELGIGRITATQAEKRLAAIPTPDRADVETSERARSYNRARRAGYDQACQALSEEAEQIITEQLRPIALDALAEPNDADSQTRWVEAHQAADVLRRHGFAPTCGASLTEHQYARPDLVHAWQLEHATRTRLLATQSQGGRAVVWRQPVGAPKPSPADAVAHPEWGPGLWTANETREHLDAIRQGQEERSRDVFAA